MVPSRSPSFTARRRSGVCALAPGTASPANGELSLVALKLSNESVQLGTLDRSRASNDDLLVR
jgi:hypothetical protein